MPGYAEPILWNRGKDEIRCAVGNAVEAVARAEDLEFFLTSHKILDLFDRCCRDELLGAVFEIAGPVRELGTLRPREQGREGG